MKLDGEVLRYVPPMLQENEQALAVFTVEGEEIKKAFAEAFAVFCNTFVKHTNEKGIEKFEALFGIVPSSADTMDERRQNVINHIIFTIPYSYWKIIEILKTGYPDSWYFSVIPNEFVVESGLEADPATVKAFNEYIRKTVPANMTILIEAPYTMLYLKKHFTLGEMGNYTVGELSRYAAAFYELYEKYPSNRVTVT